MAADIDSNNSGYWPSAEEYPIDLSKEDWKQFIQELPV